MSDLPAPTSNVVTDSDQPEQPARLIQTRHVVVAAVLLVIAIAIIILLVVLAVGHPAHTQTFRDIAIIALAAESGLIGLALLILIVQVARLTNMLEFEIKPILENTADTINTVRGTATFMSEHMVAPVIKASSYASGAARLASAIRDLLATGGRRRRGRGVGDTDISH